MAVAFPGFVCAFCAKGVYLSVDVEEYGLELRHELVGHVEGRKEVLLNDVFQHLTDQGLGDHPLCIDCTLPTRNQMASKLGELQANHAAYTKSIQDVEKVLLHATANDRNDLEEELANLQIESALLDEDLLHSQMELDFQTLEKRKIDFIASCGHENCTTLESRLGVFREELNASMIKTEYKSCFYHAQVTSYIPEGFKIEFCKQHGLINRLRLGTNGSDSVDWNEINAAWGYTSLLLQRMAKREGVTFQKYRIIPRGSCSVLERKSDHHCIDLYGSTEITFFTIFWFREYNEAMQGFLLCLNEFCKYACDNDKNLRIPHKIQGDKIGRVSVKYQMVGSNDNWVRSCRLILENLNRLQEWEAGRHDR